MIDCSSFFLNCNGARDVVVLSSVLHEERCISSKVELYSLQKDKSVFLFPLRSSDCFCVQHSLTPTVVDSKSAVMRCCVYSNDQGLCVDQLISFTFVSIVSAFHLTPTRFTQYCLFSVASRFRSHSSLCILSFHASTSHIRTMSQKAPFSLLSSILLSLTLLTAKSRIPSRNEFFTTGVSVFCKTASCSPFLWKSIVESSVRLQS